MMLLFSNSYMPECGAYELTPLTLNEFVWYILNTEFTSYVRLEHIADHIEDVTNVHVKVTTDTPTLVNGQTIIICEVRRDSRTRKSGRKEYVYRKAVFFEWEAA